MENARRTTGLLVLFATSMMTATVATSQQAPATTEDPRPAAETRWAHCLLRIVGQSNVISFSDDIVRRFVYGDDARLRGIKDVLGPISETAFGGSSRFVEIRTLERQASEASNEISLLLSLEVCLPSGVKPAAEEFLKAIVSNFREAVEVVYRSEYDRLANQAQVMQEQIAYAERELKEIQRSLVEFSARDFSYAGLRKSLTLLNAHLQDLQVDRALQEARRDSVLKRIAEIREDADRILRDDTIATELGQIINRRVGELKNAKGKVDAGMLPQGDLAALEDKLAMAKIDLARRREELAKTGSAAGLAQLTAELTTITLERDRMEAREQPLRRQLAQARAMLERSSDYERLEIKCDIARKNLMEAETANSKASQRLRMFQMPTITVVGD
jgi:hypothetical protein